MTLSHHTTYNRRQPLRATPSKQQSTALSQNGRTNTLLYTFFTLFNTFLVPFFLKKSMQNEVCNTLFTTVFVSTQKIHKLHTNKRYTHITHTCTIKQY